MGRTTKEFDAVKTMRKIRDRLSRRFEGMTFEEQNARCKPLESPSPHAPEGGHARNARRSRPAGVPSASGPGSSRSAPS